MDFLFVGLGNPGKLYENTRHNAGFMAVDALAQKFGTLNYNKKFASEYQKVKILNKNIILLKPQTFINLSGSAVLQVASFYKINPEQMWVFHDDIDLETARIKIKIGGGSGGHNGIKSIDNVIGPQYYRIRIGIKQFEKTNTSDYVLKNFNKLEMDKIDKIINNMVENIDLIIQSQIDKFLSKITL